MVSTQLKNIRQIGSFPQFSGWTKKYLKPPPSECLNYHGPPKPTFFEVFMVNHLVFRWPKPLFFMVLGAHGKDAMTRSKSPPRTPKQDRPWRHHDARAHGRRRGGESQQPNEPRWVSLPPWGPHLWQVQLGQLMLVDVTLRGIILSWYVFFWKLLFVLQGLRENRKSWFKARCEDPPWTSPL